MVQGELQKGSSALLKMQTSGANRDRTRNPTDLRSAALVYAGMLGGAMASIRPTVLG